MKIITDTMTQKADSLKAAMSAVRERIATAKRQGTHRGFIDYRGCLFVTNEFIRILEEANEAAARGEFVYAYSVAALILINLAKMAGSVDDSAGGITDARGYVEDVLEKVCSGVNGQSADAAFIFLQAVKDSQNKAFDALSAKLSQQKYGTWHLEQDCLVRLAAVLAISGKDVAEQYIADNLQYDAVRRIGIRNAITKGDFARAERLCQDRIASSDRDYYWTHEWYDRLYQVYSRSDQQEKLTKLADDLLVNKRDTAYYSILKDLLTAKGIWAAEYPILLERLARRLPYHSYQIILSEEGEIYRLLDVVQGHPESVVHYGTQLAAEFPQETYALFLVEIRKQAAEANNRINYRKVCSVIKMLYECGGVA